MGGEGGLYMYIAYLNTCQQRDIAMDAIVGPHPLVDITLAVASALVLRVILLGEVDEQLDKVCDVIFAKL